MATEIAIPDRVDPREPKLAWLLVFLLLSLGAHLGAYYELASTKLETKPPPKPVDMEIVEKPRPPPPVVKPPEPEPPKPIEKPKAQPKVKLPPPPKNAPPPPPKAEPPPPNAPPPPKAPPTPINIGLSLSSTTQAGSFAAPVGNTLYGKPADHAADPHVSQPYAAPAPTAKFVPSYQLTDPPQMLQEGNLKAFYPEEARKDGLEAQVVLQLSIDPDGHVSHAKVIKPAGHGFDEGALKAAKQMLFKPAKLDGKAVATEIAYTLTFLLD